MAAALAERGLTRVLLEGGGELATAFLRADLIDRVAWFHAPRIIGAEGLPAVGGLRIGAIVRRSRVSRLQRSARSAATCSLNT